VDDVGPLKTDRVSHPARGKQYFIILTARLGSQVNGPDGPILS
jgi:hypothetical protein